MTEGQNTFSQANWFVDLENVRGAVSAKAVYFSKIAKQLKNKALHLVVLETKKQALFFTSDLYNFFDEENVFFLPLSGGERSKESLKGVLRAPQSHGIEELTYCRWQYNPPHTAIHHQLL